MGLTGIFQIAREAFGGDGNVRIITYVLIGLVPIVMVVSIWMACVVDSIFGSYLFVLDGMGLCVILVMLYADWILAAVDHN